MKVIGFAGSNSSQSINKKLVKHTLNQMDSVETEWLEITDFPLPIFGVDLEKEKGYPENVKKFIDKLQSADGIVISLAEHNGSYSVAAKNLFDWCSRHTLKFFNDTPVLLMGTSPGGYGAKNVLGAAEKQLPKFGAQIISIYSLPSFNDTYSHEKGILSQELKDEHNACIQKLIEVISK